MHSITRNSGYLGVIKEEPDWDDDTFQFSLPMGGRLILKTPHGEIFIDARHADVNAFVFAGTNRIDIPLLTREKVDG